jgi:hypothetical protein
MPTVNLPADLYLTVGANIEQDTGTVLDRTDDGAPALRDLYAQPWYNIAAKFSLVSRAQQDTLRAFFWNNRTAELLIDLNGTTYACYVAGTIRTSFSQGGGYGSLDVQLRGREVAA